MFLAKESLMIAAVALTVTAAPAAAQMIPVPSIRVEAPDLGHAVDDKDIVEVAASAGTFNTLLAAAKAADLVDALRAEGPYTVFAPTDEAFAKLPEGTVETLLRPENKEKLKAVLLYHVVAGEVGSDEVVKLSSAKTLQGQSVDIRVEMGNVYIDDARVVAPDVEASNGVIHVIDSVILPSTN